MAIAMTPVLEPTLFYAVTSILVGSTFITYLLKFIKIDLTPFLSTKQGKVAHKISNRIYDRFLNTLSISTPLSPPPISSSLPSRGYLEGLPPRSGSRPAISGIGEPRQTTQLSSCEKGLPKRLRDLITTVSAQYPRATYLGRSTFEPCGRVALFACHRAFNATKYYGEIVSANSADASIRATLHPADIKTVIEKGWGQRHPLSSRLGSCFVRLQSGNQPGPVPGSQVLIYAPRDQAELEAVGQIVNAAVWWAGGVDNRVDGESF
ncbi:uncharacterized protein Z518_05642 [Rhinocladiella mackenziei CBS 650.93]|uniref:Luciferase domain-containing protein n=1 Tax=Rhinocladiella mackenziei CBS 650.93 TaxID=1442369 RepID=A0A0D2FRG2_9EURO|nr:uncharacterized protein Z518_05642 [Rhinocladiella mackenziei CBS 650.93]KIX04772.1 hypothetical protein Z518_05642 [Rhinocladiella mackenziei CBS 650.93]